MYKFQDKLPAPTSRTMKDSGELVAPCTFARAGVMNYLARELSPLFDDLPPNQIVRVMRTADELYKDSVVEALKSAPITIGHPKDDVCVANYKELAVGVLSGLPHKDEDSQGVAVLAGELVLNDQSAIDLTNPENPEGKNGLSLGYTADLIRVKDCATHDAEQMNIRPNHIAIVPIGRAGADYRIGDSDEVLAELEKEEATKAAAEAAITAEEVPNVATQEAQEESTPAEVQTPTDDIQTKLADAVAKVDELQAKLDAAEAALADKKDLRFSDEDILELVNKKVAFLVLAKQFSDEDFTQVTEQDAMRKIVSAKFGDMSAKSDAYVAARFEIMQEEKPETSAMAEILSHQAGLAFVDSAPKMDAATQARERMISKYSATS